MKTRWAGLTVLHLVVLLAMICAPQAKATAELTISDGLGNTVDILDNGAAVCVGASGCVDANGLGNVVTYVGSLGTWNLNVSTGASHGALGGTDLDLNSINNTTAAGTLTIMFSDDGYPASGSFGFHVGGTVTGAPATLTYSAFAGASKFALTNQIGSNLVFTTNPFSGSTAGSAVGSALTEKAVLNFTGAGGTSFDAALTPVPEPASVSLLGGALLLGVAVIRRKLSRG